MLQNREGGQDLRENLILKFNHQKKRFSASIGGVKLWNRQNTQLKHISDRNHFKYKYKPFVLSKHGEEES